MNKIKQQFSDLRKNTPKHIQWLLLAAAFIVVLILLTLLLTGRNTTTVQDTETVAAKLNINPDTVDWGDTKVGEKRTQAIKITASAPVKILKIRLSKEIAGFPVPRQTCTTIGNITNDIPCSVSLEYEPGVAAAAQSAPLYIDWRNADESDEMYRTEKIMITLGAVAPEPEKKPEPEPEPEPKQEPTPTVEPTPVKEEIKREIESIAPAAPLAFEEEEKEEYIEPIAPAQETQPAVQPEACSDFAFPGYNASGNQIGWIKPERGAYYFHPFSDKKCDTPTGVYNPDNGIITSIDGKGTKIGTDAEHIGYTTIVNGTIPQLSNAPAQKVVHRAEQSEAPEDSMGSGRLSPDGWATMGGITPAPKEVTYGTTDGAVQVATQPYDRTFILRQYKPIPATIVSDVRADAVLSGENIHFPVRATVDRNVYSDNGRTVIIPTGTLLLGFVTGEVPGPYKSIGRMNIKWYQFVLPNGVEFNFSGQEPVSADSQGRIGVPGRGSTDYLEQFVMPMLTAIVPAAVNMIAPVADKFVNQIDLDNNTVVQSGTLRSSELAKNEIITAWNQVAQKLMVDMMDNTVPPFTIPAGTRITVYSPTDLAVACTDEGKKCYMDDLATRANKTRAEPNWESVTAAQDDSWVGQVRSFSSQNYCVQDDNKLWTARPDCAQGNCGGYSYRTLLLYCQSLNYQAKNMVRQEQLFQNQQSADNKNSIANISAQGQQAYNEQVLGLKYDEDTGAIQNPFQTLPKEEAPATIKCEDGTNPDANGCCTGEIYTDMGEQGFNCCPESGGDCFPPIL